MPTEGSDFQIKSYKHNGRLHRTWESNLVLHRTNDRLIGVNDHTIVREGSGEVWRTQEVAICCFYTDYWFNVIAMIDTDGVHYYCNLSSPFIYENRTVKYIDYDLDIQVSPDMTYEILDKDEFVEHKLEMDYSHELVSKLWEHVDCLIRLITEQKEPFAPHFIEKWYEQYVSCKQNP